MKPWMVWPAAAAIPCFGVAVCLAAAYFGEIHWHRIDEAKTVWYRAHECKPAGYIGLRTAYRLHRCNDGLEYVWDDIPYREP